MTNARYYAGKAESPVPMLAVQFRRVNRAKVVGVLDPPRGGLGKWPKRVSSAGSAGLKVAWTPLPQA